MSKPISEQSPLASMVTLAAELRRKGLNDTLILSELVQRGLTLKAADQILAALNTPKINPGRRLERVLLLLLVVVIAGFALLFWKSAQNRQQERQAAAKQLFGTLPTEAQNTINETIKGYTGTTLYTLLDIQQAPYPRNLHLAASLRIRGFFYAETTTVGAWCIIFNPPTIDTRIKGLVVYSYEEYASSRFGDSFRNVGFYGTGYDIPSASVTGANGTAQTLDEPKDIMRALFQTIGCTNWIE